MTLRSLFASTLVTAALSLAASAYAHDTSMPYDDLPPAPKAKPVNCGQLADNEHYSNNMMDPDIKALKVRCDAQQKDVKKPVPIKIQ